MVGISWQTCQQRIVEDVALGAGQILYMCCLPKTSLSTPIGIPIKDENLLNVCNICMSLLELYF